jgi:hypothetical protein
VNTVGACFHATTPFPRLLKWFRVDNQARNKIQISILNPCFSTRDMFHPRPRDMTSCEPRHILTTPILLPTSTSRTSHDTLRLKPPSRRKQISRVSQCGWNAGTPPKASQRSTFHKDSCNLSFAFPNWLDGNFMAYPCCATVAALERDGTAGM